MMCGYANVRMILLGLHRLEKDYTDFIGGFKSGMVNVFDADRFLQFPPGGRQGGV
jgi:hypothetical protein